MSRARHYATTALGVCIAAMPLTAAGQTTEEMALFAPAVQTCLAAPSAETCGPVRDVVAACAADIDAAQCAEVFADAAAVRDNPAQIDLARQVLSEARDALAQQELGATDASPEADAIPGETEADEVVVPEAVVPPEATSEDSGEVVTVPEDALTEPALPEDGDAAVPLEGGDVTDDSSTQGEPIEDAAGIGADPEAGNEGLPDAGAPADAGQDRDTAAATEGDEAPDVAQDVEVLTDTEAAAETENPADSDMPEAPMDEEVADADPEDQQTEADIGTGADEGVESEEEQRLREALQAEEAVTADPEADVEEEGMNRETLSGQLREEAEAMATEAPELVVEEVTAEEFVAPADAVPEIDAEQQGVVDRLLEDPDVAKAVSVLGETAAGDAQETAAAVGDRVPEALVELRERGEGGAEEETADTGAREVIDEEITASDVRTSDTEFDSRLALGSDTAAAEDEGLSDLERAGLAALGALAVGMIIDQNRVVARSDERVVVQRDDGEYTVWRDDDVLLLQEGADRRIERYDDGSTLTRWNRPDGSQVISVRDATGRLLWRELVLEDGTSVELVNEYRETEPLDVGDLPPPRVREVVFTERTDPDLARALLEEAEADARDLGRTFTLRQVREVREVRELVPVLSPDPITFEVDRANVRPDEARKLAQVGRLMEQLIEENPGEVFLIEGHTDATGPAAYNLALSDRRAESVALALTEFFAIPPENLIIQGFGERHLRVPTVEAEERNRRVAIRRITPLMGL